MVIPMKNLFVPEKGNVQCAAAQKKPKNAGGKTLPPH